MRKKTTIIDIAKHLGISPSAVSKALSNHPRISEKTKKAVWQASKKLGYQPNTMATGLRVGRSKLIGVLVPGIHYSFFATVIKGIEETLSDHGYNVIITQSQDDWDKECQQLAGLLNAQVEGIIASVGLTTTTDEYYQRLVGRVPLVLFDRTLPGVDTSKIVIDDHAGSLKAIAHLVDKGYRRIAHIAGQSHIEPFRIRIEGYLESLKQHNLPFVDDYLIECPLGIADGEDIAKQLLALPEPPDAFYAASDYPAFGVLQYLAGQGHHVPNDFGVVGFSNEAYTAMVRPTLTTIDQHSENMGVLAAKSMIEQLEHLYANREYIPQRNTLSPKLIVRESTNKQ